MRPAPGLLAGAREAFSRATATAKVGGASKLSRPAQKFQRPISAHPRSHSTSAAVAVSSSWRNALEHVSNGIFRSIRSAAIPRPGPYTSQRLAPHPSSSPSSPFSSLARSAAPRRVPPSSRFGPTPRPVASRTTSTTLGLSTARQFSSSSFGVLDNVIHNAPLALRALSGQFEDGLDDRKWRKVRREIREKNRKEVKGQGASLGWEKEMKEKRDEFELYFGGRAASAAAVAVVEPVTLVLALEPAVDFPLSSSSSTSLDASIDPAHERLLTPTLLSSFSAITTAYTTHTHLLQALINRLSAAGLLDPVVAGSSGMGTDERGRRVWCVRFSGGEVGRKRVERVIRGEIASIVQDDDEVELDLDAKVRRWHRAVASPVSAAIDDGEGVWWSLTGGDYSSSSTASVVDTTFSPFLVSFTPSIVSAAPSSRASSVIGHVADDIDAAHAFAVAETFFLPDPPSFSSSSPSSPSAASAASAAGLTYAYSPPAPPSPPARASSEHADDWSLHSSSPSESLASLSLSASSLPALELELELDDGLYVRDPAIAAWEEDLAVEEDWRSWSASASAVSSSASELDRMEEGDGGLRAFVEEVEEEMGRREGWGFA